MIRLGITQFLKVVDRGRLTPVPYGAVTLWFGYGVVLKGVSIHTPHETRHFIVEGRL